MFLASFFSNIAHFFIQGGFFMFLLVLLSIAAVAVMILRGRALRESNVLTPEIRDEIERLAPGDSLLPLQQMAGSSASALGKVVMVVLKHLTWPRGETIEAVQLCQDNNWGTFISHRSGETVDSFIADMTVGLRAGHLKTGAPSRGERIEKYNQLMRIEDELGDAAIFAGKAAFKKR